VLVGIHEKCKFEPHSRFLERYETILDYNGIDRISLDANNPQFWEQVSQLDLFIYRWRHTDYDRQIAMTIIPIVENVIGIKCFPNMATCWCYDDKIREYFLLKQNGFPMAQSWVFWDRKLALRWVETAELPLVFKLKCGAASSNVVLVRNRAFARKLIKTMFGLGIKSGQMLTPSASLTNVLNLYKEVRHWGGNILRRLGRKDNSTTWQRHKNYVLFQKFLAGNDHDTRIVIIGNRALAVKRGNRENDFRASGSGILDYSPEGIDKRFLTIAFEISKKLGFQSMGYDFLYDENNNPQISEISYTFPYGKFLSDCPGYWDSTLEWHEGHYWPQYFQLIDALGMPDLKHLEMTII